MLDVFNAFSFFFLLLTVFAVYRCACMYESIFENVLSPMTLKFRGNVEKFLS